MAAPGKVASQDDFVFREFVYRSTMATQTTRTSSRTNRLIAIVSGAIALATIGANFVNADNSNSLESTTTSVWETTSSSAPDSTIPEDTSPDHEPIGAEEEKDASDFEWGDNSSIDPAIGKSFVRDINSEVSALSDLFSDQIPFRAPPLNSHPFKSGIYDSLNLNGSWQSPYISRFIPLSKKGLTCSTTEDRWVGLMACGIAETQYGRFQITVDRSSVNSSIWQQFDSFDITVFIEVTRNKKKFAQSVLQSRFESSKCASPYAQGTLSIDKLNAGDEELFVISLGGGFLTNKDLWYNRNNDSKQQTVIAMNPSGMPEVIASYVVSQPRQLAATKQSLLFTFGDGTGFGEDEFENGTLIELQRTTEGWREKIRAIGTGANSLTKISDAWIEGKVGIRGLAHPLSLLNYTTLRYLKEYKAYCSDYVEE